MKYGSQTGIRKQLFPTESGRAANENYCFHRYLYTFSKNDITSSVQKRYCVFGAEVSVDTFSVKRVFKQV